MIFKDISEVKTIHTSDLFDGAIVATNGRLHDLYALPGFVAMSDEGTLGTISYLIENEDCEIVSLESKKENHGIGSALLQLVIDHAKKANCKRVWLVTTNENIRAIRFYQKRGFDMKAIHRHAVEAARKLKPSIPLTSEDGIPIRHEIEFEILL
ncbi:GNAT family N-acetyltransferase [Paenibacillus sanfengchensis]|uniref:GNAT family N-acetyltransferase n=1 Tax=Paenibacillus sanfengchensis TaxID=3119819 RepID=UPI002FE2063E